MVAGQGRVPQRDLRIGAAGRIERTSEQVAQVHDQVGRLRTQVCQNGFECEQRAPGKLKAEDPIPYTTWQRLWRTTGAWGNLWKQQLRDKVLAESFQPQTETQLKTAQCYMVAALLSRPYAFSRLPCVQDPALLFPSLPFSILLLSRCPSWSFVLISPRSAMVSPSWAHYLHA